MSSSASTEKSSNRNRSSARCGALLPAVPHVLTAGRVSLEGGNVKIEDFADELRSAPAERRAARFMLAWLIVAIVVSAAVVVAMLGWIGL